jgi:hypothetical protein
MANESSKMLERLIQEASAPETDPERLQELANSTDDDVRRSAWKNPNLPEEVWRKILLRGAPEAWANPMAPFYLLAWTPRKDDWRTLEYAALVATESLWVKPEQCSVEGKQLLTTKVFEWWTTSESALDMMHFLARWASFRGIGSQEHKDVMQILVQCVKTMPNLTREDRDLLHSVEQWSKGREPHPTEVAETNYSDPVRYTYLSTKNPFPNTMYAVHKVLEYVASKKSKDRLQAYKEANAEHNRLLAELIRQEMPVPPTAE